MAEPEKKVTYLQGKAESPYPLGVERKDRKIRFAIEMEKEKNCGLVLYGENKEFKFPFSQAKKCGTIYYGVLEIPEEDRFTSYQIYSDYTKGPDSYAKQVLGNEVWGKSANFTQPPFLRGRLLIKDFDWEGDEPLQIPYEESILYCLHVRGFTKHTSSRVSAKGTFLGITQKIPYLKELGITGIELMPCYEFVETELDIQEVSNYSLEYSKQHCYDELTPKDKPGRINYWGYKEGYYFSPKASYSYSRDAVTEIKDMIKKLHQNGIEVIVQMYFPKEVRHGYLLDAARFWVNEYHIDGIHFLGEDIPVSLIETEPLLAHTKIMFNNIGGTGSYDKEMEKKRNLASYRDDYMETLRRFLKGDEDMLPSLLEQMKTNPKSYAAVNFITNYYGFTLNDLVSYDKKHNENNGEGNRDGNDYNYSWNCGMEGKTKKRAIIAMRKKQAKNAIALLLLSQGTPLILSGDEFLNSQQGNNNAYCQDNEIGWVNWDRLKANALFWNYVKELIALRKAHPILHPAAEFRNMDYLSCGYPDLSYHGEEAWRPIIENYNRHVGIMYCGKYAKMQKKKEDNFFYIACNMHWIPHTFALPKLPNAYEWQLLIDTGTETGFLEQGSTENVPEKQQKVSVKERLVQIYIGVKKTKL